MSAQYVRHTFLLHPADRLLLGRLCKDDERSHSATIRVLIRKEADRRGWSDTDWTVTIKDESDTSKES